MRANSGTFLISSSEQGTIYYAVLELGTNKQSVTQSQIYNQNVRNAISYGSQETAPSNNIATIQS